MWKRISRIPVAAEALCRTHDSRYRGENAEKNRAGRVALRWIVPFFLVEAEEEFDVAKDVRH